MTIAAIVAVVLLAVIVVFQLALAIGAPMGSAAWGGKHDGALPRGLRIASVVVAIVIYPLIALFVLGSSDLIDVDWLPTGKVAMWILAAFFALGSIANFTSRSVRERVWGPVSLAIAICSAAIAIAI